MPDLIMVVDTALPEVPVNLLPLLDDTDFKSRETAVAYNAAGMDLVWNFVTTEGAYTQTAVTPTSGGAYDWAHQGDGMYTIEIPDSGGASINNNALGFGWFTGFATGVLPWRGPTIQFSPANVVNSLVQGTDQLDVNVSQFGGSNGTFSGGRAEVNASHWGGTAVASALVRGNVIQWTGTNVTTPDTAGSPKVTLTAGTGTGQISLSSGAVLLQATQTGVTIPTVTTLTNAPSDSSGVTTLLSRLPAGLFTGLTNFAQWLGAIAGKQAANSTAQTEIRASGAGSGTYDATTDSQEAIRDNMGTSQTGDAFARLGAPAGASVSADIAAAKSDTAAIKAKTDNLPASPAAVGSAMTLTSGERDSIAAALLDLSNGIETSITPRQAMRLILAASAGKLSGAATTTITIRNVGDSKNRITATVDSDGNRSAVTVDAT